MAGRYAKEADLVADFCREVERLNGLTHYEHPIWTAYHETAGWDLLLVDRETGTQIGIEAKLTVNAKVIEQALKGPYTDVNGPDFRAILVPDSGLQLHLRTIALALGFTIIVVRSRSYGPEVVEINPTLPSSDRWWGGIEKWVPWHPEKRETLPDYVPDVMGGHAAPVALTDWKVKAIKLLILLDRRGFVTRRDMDHFKLSYSRWTCWRSGYLVRDPGLGYVRCQRTPNLKRQHPRNWAEIEADFDTWAPKNPLAT